MKTKPVILVAAISALLVSGAAAQQPAPPTTPPPSTPPPPAAEAPRRPERPRDANAPRPAGGPREGEARREGGPRDGGRGPREDGPRDGGPREGGPRGGGPRDGEGRPPGGPREGGPRDGAGHPEGGREGTGPRGERPPSAAPARKEKKPFLGVMSVPLSPPLAAQLGFAEGFGLVVQEVAPESPAAKAGVQKFDVIKLLNDQQIVDQAQLATLVTSLGTGKEVALTVIRKAQEQKLTVTLGEHEVTVREGMSGRPMGGPGVFGGLVPGLDDRQRQMMERAHDMQERLRHMPDHGKEMQEHMRDLQRRMQEGRGPREGGGKPSALIEPERLLQEAQRPGGSSIRVETEAGSTTLNGGQAHLRVKDNSGEIEVASQDGQRVLTARDPEGKVVFTGPMNTEEERAAVPEVYRKKIEQIHIRQSGNGITSSVAVTEVPLADEELTEDDFQ